MRITNVSSPSSPFSSGFELILIKTENFPNSVNYYTLNQPYIEY